MKKTFLIVAALLIMSILQGCGMNSAEKEGYQGIDTESPEWVGKLDAAKSAEQMFIVAAFDEEATDAWISLHEKQKDGTWHMVMTTPGFIGKNGLGKTKEGDGKTPVGEFKFNRAFGIADDPGCAIPYVKVDKDTYWSGDPRDGFHYNELVNLKDLPKLDIESGDSEHIIDYTYHYQYCLNISYNEEGTPGVGSAIFLHCFGPVKPFTGGCVAIPEDRMKYVMQNVDENTVVVINTFKELSGGEEWPDSTWPPEGRKDVKAEVQETKAADGRKLSDDASDFVLLSEAVPDVIQEIRYYSTYNFVGDRIKGYEQPTALLTKEAAKALKEVSDDLIAKGYRLKIFDAYRPQMAVENFMEWAKDVDDTRMKDYFYPELDKSVLFKQGYIAEFSGHSRGSTVDLTLFDMKKEKEVDMGGTFDYFGELSHPDYTGITDKQYKNRMILREAMLAHGFRPLEEEWWHFTLDEEPYQDTYFTFPVSEESVK